MTQNPFINAFAASLYIIGIVNFLFFLDPDHIEGPTMFVPIIMLSLFTLSAAAMSYVFLFEPLKLILAGAHERGVHLFLQTLGVFACLIALIAALFYSGVIR